MKSNQIVQSPSFGVPASRLFSAWLDSQEHSSMTGGTAEINPKVGGTFMAWDGEIVGKTIEIDPKISRIVQEWRYDYDDWPADKPSTITLEFVQNQDNPNTSTLNFSQNGIPDQYVDEIADGWRDYYWEPMQHYFSKNS